MGPYAPKDIADDPLVLQAFSDIRKSLKPPFHDNSTDTIHDQLLLSLAGNLFFKLRDLGLTKSDDKIKRAYSMLLVGLLQLLQLYDTMVNQMPANLLLVVETAFVEQPLSLDNAGPEGAPN